MNFGLLDFLVREEFVEAFRSNLLNEPILLARLSTPNLRRKFPLYSKLLKFEIHRMVQFVARFYGYRYSLGCGANIKLWF